MDLLFSLHKEEYGTKPEVIAKAPGVVNLMGEHTDISSGFVLQAALDTNVYVAMSRRKDNSLRFYSEELRERKRTTIANLKFKKEDRWANYIKGVIYEIFQMGHTTKGLNITISGNVPQGIGLGASAAVGIATAVALRELIEHSIDDLKLVHAAYLSETAFLNVKGRFADQYTSYFAKSKHALFIDLRAYTHQLIPVVRGDAVFIITNSNVPPVPVEDEITAREEMCKDSVEVLKQKRNASVLRDYSETELKTDLGFLSETARRLCLHVVQENHRVLDAMEALKHDKLDMFGKYMNRSHESLRDNFEVSCPELDWLVKRAIELEGCYGSRMVGPGFGGCTLTLIKKDSIERYQERLDEYERIFGFHPSFFVVNPSQGAGIEYSIH